MTARAGEELADPNGSIPTVGRCQPPRYTMTWVRQLDTFFDLSDLIGYQAMGLPMYCFGRLFARRLY
jgi:hypothetical protein